MTTPAATAVPALLALDDVYRRLQLSRRSVERLLADGRLRSIKIGKRRLVDERDLVAFIDGLRQQQL